MKAFTHGRIAENPFAKALLTVSGSQIPDRKIHNARLLPEPGTAVSVLCFCLDLSGIAGQCFLTRSQFCLQKRGTYCHLR